MLLPEVAAVAGIHRGVFLRRHALAGGYSADEVRRRLACREWVAVRRGAYCEGQLWTAADEPERHRMRVHAVSMVLDEPAVFSHTSAATMLGLRTWGVSLGTVHVTRGDLRSGRHEGGVQHHPAGLPEGDVVEVEGLRVTTPARTAVDVARLAGAEAGLVTADSAAAHPACSVELIRAAAARMSDWPGARAAGCMAEMVDARSESGGESRFRYRWVMSGCGELELQVEVTIGGVVVARLDGYDVAADIGHEFDGRSKYRLDAARNKDEAAEILWAEKRREDQIRRVITGLERWIWFDLEQPDRTAARMRATAARGRRTR